MRRISFSGIRLRKCSECRCIGIECQSNLSEIIRAQCRPCAVSDGADRSSCQRCDDRDDTDHHEYFDERHAPTVTRVVFHGPISPERMRNSK
ncbi:hypothetical protein FGO68_gene16074 [Halteria grandinella]|uniref:Uncharacterized protein n=1 Tax=Halteria grandinella TaxID=5974 RepID=A0A8J8NAL1_HALGN|nr:hypothetical protein FGO68_gene16074 [Halteria grandinella]